MGNLIIYLFHLWSSMDVGRITDQFSLKGEVELLYVFSIFIFIISMENMYKLQDKFSIKDQYIIIAKMCGNLGENYTWNRAHHFIGDYDHKNYLPIRLPLFLLGGGVRVPLRSKGARASAAMQVISVSNLQFGIKIVEGEFLWSSIIIN